MTEGPCSITVAYSIDDPLPAGGIGVATRKEMPATLALLRHGYQTGF
jgi:hypothetical protein